MSCAFKIEFKQFYEISFSTLQSLVKFLAEAHRGVQGFVTDDLGNPVEKASLKIKGRDVGFQTTKYGEFWRILLPGIYKLEVYADGYVPREIDFMVVEQHPTLLNVTLHTSKVSSPLQHDKHWRPPWSLHKPSPTTSFAWLASQRGNSSPASHGSNSLTSHGSNSLTSQSKDSRLASHGSSEHARNNLLASQKLDAWLTSQSSHRSNAHAIPGDRAMRIEELSLVSSAHAHTNGCSAHVYCVAFYLVVVRWKT
ncbi:uncharacterized protein LOC103505414 isoform X1 [Diaphorina citri]|uniref:Uncharacterized protein LOC103505414 isoform X1 n=1 Tax=Diaphorina citri TaxID=121845 RepID=A0A3Q0IQE9_DIACI|nr:uncharacterized protein LOC103505414 isoform X1 [Diaphorina citri]